MKYAYWVVLLACLTSQYAMAQSTLDSLTAVLKSIYKNSDHVKTSRTLSRIGYEYMSLQQYDRALAYYDSSLHYSTADDTLMASTFNAIGVVYHHKAFPDSSVAYYNKALDLYRHIRDTTNTVITATNLSIIYKNKGLYEKSLDYAFNALALLERQRPDRALASCCNTIGAVYAKIGDYANALRYNERALAIRKQIDYSKGVAQSYNNIGELYLTMHVYDSALTNLFRSLDIKRKNNDTHGMGSTLYFIGEAYVDLHQAKEAEPYFTESRQIKKESGERLEEAMALNGIGKIKLLQGQWHEAELYLNEADALIRQTGALEELRKNLTLKVNLYKTKNPVKALRYAEELLIIKDSLLNKEKAEGLLAMQARYETEKKEEHISVLEQASTLQQAEIETKKIWIQSLVVIAALIFVIGMLLYYSYRFSQRSRRKVEMLLKELHHRVKNNLQILSSVLSLQSNYVKDDDAIQVIKSSESRVNTMALIHKKLYRVEHNRTINMYDYALELCGYLIHTYGYTEQSLELNIQGKAVTVDVDKAIPIGLILNELVSNALKYAYKQQIHPKLTLLLNLYHQHELVIEVRDNGMGITENRTPETTQSFGLKMVDTLIKELKGKLLVITDHGTAYFIHIPLI